MPKLSEEVSKRRRTVCNEIARIVRDGTIRPGGIVKVDNFLNHQLDVELLDECGKEFARLFKDKRVTKILTIEASGIAIAICAARHMGNIPVVFAKKAQTKNVDDDVYQTPVMSFTHGREFMVRVAKKYISPDDKLLIIDDFLANGKAVLGLLDIAEQAGAEVAGVGICVEKVFQDGGAIVRDMGVEVHSLAMIDLDENGEMTFVQSR